MESAIDAFMISLFLVGICAISFSAGFSTAKRKYQNTPTVDEICRLAAEVAKVDRGES